MIVVFAEFGGERLLGKARDLADSLGLRVLAVYSGEKENEGDFSQRLIYLGADEVNKYKGGKTVFDWANILSSLLKEKSQVSIMFGISGCLTDAIFGHAYALAKEKIGSFATGIDSISENGGTKYLRTWNASLQFRPAADGKVSVFSFKSSAVPEPFEDSSRYGKSNEIEMKPAENQKTSPSTVELEKREFLDSSAQLTILLSKSLLQDEGQNKAVQNLAAKYKANIVNYSSQIQEVYGPCLALCIESKHERELPKFHGELVSINKLADRAAISNVADLRVFTSDIGKVLQEL